MKIYLRKELGMRRGKSIAQAAHAGMKLLLQAMERIPEGFLATGEAREAILAYAKTPTIELQQVNDAEFAMCQEESTQQGLATALIEDHGHTEFHGRLTITALAVGDSRLSERTQRRIAQGTPTRAKQIIVIHRNNEGQSAEAKRLQIALGAAASVKMLLDLMHDDGHQLALPMPEGSPLAAWLQGPFAKITLGFQGEESAWQALQEAIVARGISVHGDAPNAFATGAAWPEDIDAITGTLKLL